MSMDQVDSIRRLETSNQPHNSREQESTCGGKPKPAGKGEIAQPLSVRHGLRFLPSLPVKRLDRENAICDPQLGQSPERFCNEATTSIISLAGIKRCKRKNVERRSISADTKIVQNR